MIPVRRDPSLQHQVVIGTTRVTGGDPITVTCNCRQRAGLQPMGPTNSISETMRLYNDPERHVEPFGQEWMLNRNHPWLGEGWRPW